MKLIISSGGVKRELGTPFALCISKEDLDKLIRELKFARSGMDGIETTMAWLRIDPSHPCDAPSNTKPLGWGESMPHEPAGCWVPAPNLPR